MTILVTGGAGYIGSHTILELIAAGHDVVAVDNFANSSPEVLTRLKTISGQTIKFYELDVADQGALGKVFTAHKFDAVIHFAGLKAVGESSANPLKYYRTNLDTTLTLAETMAAHHVYQLVFSSSATVYGHTTAVRYTETMPLAPVNPYGWTKLMNEQILRDLAVSDPQWRISLLRYFNPIGAHSSGLIGDDPAGTPNNLLPYVAQVAVGRLAKLPVYGNDYPTPDGTGIRDYLHVTDLAIGHLRALEHPPKAGHATAYNLGTGQGHSVLEVVKAFEEASGKQIPTEIMPRRAGDLPEYFADPQKAHDQLKWQATKTLADMCADTWRWQSQNPNGY